MSDTSSCVKKGIAAGCAAAVAFCAGTVIFGVLAIGVLVKCAAAWSAPSDGGFDEVFVAGIGDATEPRVVRVKLTGDIGPAPASALSGLLGDVLPASNASTGGAGSFEQAQAHIRAAAEDASVRGLYLTIDTPGGDLTDSDILWHDVMRFKALQPNRFVLAHMGAQCCSGGYYVAVAADCIMALPTSETGSIGVMTDYGYNVSELARRFGVTNMVVATGVNKDTLNPLQSIDPRQVAIERDLLQSQFERFVQIVAKGRNLPLEKVRELSDGRAYAAPDALKKGLIDCIGYDEDALEKLCELAGAKNVYVFCYEDPLESGWERFLRKGLFHAFRKDSRRGMSSRGTLARRR